MCRTTTGTTPQQNNIKMKGTKKEGRNKTPPRESGAASTTEINEVIEVTTATTAKQLKRFTPQQEQAFKELQLKFIINLPTKEQESLPRLFFQIEQAHWYYEDFLADQKNSGLPHISLYDFGSQMCSFCKPLQVLKPQYKQCYEEFMTYKNLVPTYGCILLNEKCDKVLLVRNWKGTCWSFPKGKLNENEDPAECAMREVDEEIGYRPFVDRDNHITFLNDNGQHSSMFIVPNVPEDFHFEPRARKEISKIQFFDLNEALPNEKFNFNKYKPELKQWIKNYKRSQKNKPKKISPMSESVSSLFDMGGSTNVSSLFGSAAAAAPANVTMLKANNVASREKDSPKSVLGVTVRKEETSTTSSNGLKTGKFSFKIDDVFATN